MTESDTAGLKVAIELDDLLELTRLAKRAMIRAVFDERVRGEKEDGDALCEAINKVMAEAGEDLARQEERLAT